MFSCVHAVREAFKWLTGDNALACEHWRQWIQLMLTLLEHECNNGWDTRGMAWFSYLECRTARFKKQWRRRHWPLIIHAHWLRTLLLAFAVNMLASCSAHMIRGAYGAQWPVLATGCLLLKLTGVLPACFQVNQSKKPFYGMISYEHRTADFDSDGDFNCFMRTHRKPHFPRFRWKRSSTGHVIFGSVDGIDFQHSIVSQFHAEIVLWFH